jgi:hypothetical protein
MRDTLHAGVVSKLCTRDGRLISPASASRRFHHSSIVVGTDVKCGELVIGILVRVTDNLQSSLKSRYLVDLACKISHQLHLSVHWQEIHRWKAELVNSPDMT